VGVDPLGVDRVHHRLARRTDRDGDLQLRLPRPRHPRHLGYTMQRGGSRHTRVGESGRVTVTATVTVIVTVTARVHPRRKVTPTGRVYCKCILGGHTKKVYQERRTEMPTKEGASGREAVCEA